MEDPPKDPRVRAMLAMLLGDDWEKLEGDVAFEKGPVDSWIYAAERMLVAADAVDPIRVAVRELVQGEGEDGEPGGGGMPSRSQG